MLNQESQISKATRIALLNEVINTPNPRGPNMMIKALETLGITRPEVSEAGPQRSKSKQKVTEKCLIF